METLIKIILALLFFVCLLRMPYGYYEFVRFAAFIGFAILAYIAFTRNAMIELIIYAGLALLFQPFLKIALGRTLWNVVDVIVGIGLIASILLARKTEK